MNGIKKYIVLGAAVLCIVFPISAYEWVFNNRTNKRLMISMKLHAKSDARFWTLVSPERKAVFSWNFPYCYNAIEVFEYNPLKYDPKAEDLYNLPDGEYGDTSNQALLIYLDRAIWSTPSIFYAENPSSAKFQKNLANVIQETSKLGVGVLDQIVKAYTGTEMFQLSGDNFDRYIAYLAGLIVASIETSRCISRVFDVYAGVEKDIVTEQERPHYMLVTGYPREMTLEEFKKSLKEKSQKMEEEEQEIREKKVEKTFEEKFEEEFEKLFEITPEA